MTFMSNMEGSNGNEKQGINPLTAEVLKHSGEGESSAIESSLRRILSGVDSRRVGDLLIQSKVLEHLRGDKVLFYKDSKGEVIDSAEEGFFSKESNPIIKDLNNLPYELREGCNIIYFKNDQMISHFLNDSVLSEKLEELKDKTFILYSNKLSNLKEKIEIPNYKNNPTSCDNIIETKGNGTAVVLFETNYRAGYIHVGTSD